MNTNEKQRKRDILVRQELLKEVFENVGLGSFFQLETKDFIQSSTPMTPGGKIVGELSYEEKIFYTIAEILAREHDLLNDVVFDKIQNHNEEREEYSEEELLAEMTKVENMEKSYKIASDILYYLLKKKYNPSDYILRIVDGWKVQLTPSPNGEV